MDPIDPWQYQDVTQLVAGYGEPDPGHCIVIINSTTAQDWINNSPSGNPTTGNDSTLATYTLWANKWVQTNEDDTQNFDSHPSYCLGTDAVSTLPGRFDFVAPAYFSLAIASALIIGIVAYKLILRPFWRPRT